MENENLNQVPSPVPGQVPIAPSSPRMPAEEMVMPTAGVLHAETGMPGNSSKGGRGFGRKWIIIIAAVVVVIIAVLVMLFLIFMEGKTAYGQKFQDKIWANFIDDAGVAPLTAQFSIKYTDSGHFEFVPSELFASLDLTASSSETDDINKYAFTLDSLEASFSANGFVSLTDLKNPKFDGTVSGAVKNNGGEYSVTVDGKAKDQTGFVKYNMNQALANWADSKGFLDDRTKEQVGKWLKFSDSANANGFQDLGEALSGRGDQASAEQKAREVWKNNRPFDIKSFKGVTIMNGKPVFHYSLELNKPRIKTAMQESFKASMGEYQDESATTYFNTVTDIFLEKIEVKQFEVWVGVTDKKVYKTIIETNAVSLTKTLDMLYKDVLNGKYIQEAQTNARDAKRVADMRQMASALELYYNDQGKYPNAENGQPVGISPTYIGTIPQSPTPTMEPCTDYNNTYWYESKGSNPYTYSFCLSTETAGLKAGPHTMTERGIDGGILPASDIVTDPSMESFEDYPSDSISTEDPFQKIQKTFLDLYRSLPWDATIRIESASKDYGKDKDIQLPTDFVDINQSYNPQYDDAAVETQQIDLNSGGR